MPTGSTPSTDHGESFFATHARAPSRTAIEVAAARLFRARGFSAVTVRAIAAEAEVNPALVIRHFGSKEQLFLGVMAMSPALGAAGTGPRLADVFAAPTHTLGHRLVGYVWDESQNPDARVREVYVALTRADHIPEVRHRLRQVLDEHLVAPIAARFAGPRAHHRAEMVTVQLTGLMAALWGGDDLLDEVDTPDLLELYGGAVQHLIDTAASVRPA